MDTKLPDCARVGATPAQAAIFYLAQTHDARALALFEKLLAGR